MALTPQKPKRVSAGIVTIILSFLSIVIMTVWLLEGPAGPLHTLRAGSMILATPFQYIGSIIGVPFNAAGNAVENFTTKTEDLDALRTKNEELQARLIQMEEARQENERLLALFKMVNAYSLEACGARIISRTTDSWNRTITIDKGRLDGLEVGMPVLSADGLIGQIETVGLFTSTVRLITDPRSGVAVILQQTARAEGILMGSHEGLLYLTFISPDVSVALGDAVITSGAGGTYPKGLVIGYVASITQDPSNVYQIIVVTPIQNVTAFEEVAVVTGRQSEVVWNPTPNTNTFGNAENSGQLSSGDNTAPAPTGEG